MHGTTGVVRGFFIALAVSLGLPMAMIFLALSSGGFAMLYAYVVAPQLAYAYPAILFSAMSEHALLLSVIQMVILSLLFGLLMHERRGGSQFLWALTALFAWWLVWKIAGLAFGLAPDFDVRM